MQSFGATRFTIEGKPGGPVVFACLIPVAGRQAVTERFEAEGDDIIKRHKPLCGHRIMARDPTTRAIKQFRRKRLEIERNLPQRGQT